MVTHIHCDAVDSNNIKQYYANLQNIDKNIFNEINNIIDNTYGEDSAFVKWIFHSYHALMSIIKNNSIQTK